MHTALKSGEKKLHILPKYYERAKISFFPLRRNLLHKQGFFGTFRWKKYKKLEVGNL